MRAILLALGWVLSLAAARADSTSEIKSGDFAVQIAARAQANLVYHLDCLARQVTCTNDVFEKLWHGQLGISAEDERQIQTWGRVRGQVRSDSSSGDRSAPVKASVPIHDERDNTLWNR